VRLAKMKCTGLQT